MDFSINSIIYEYFTEILVCKNEFILTAGETENHLYFVEEGILRMFYYDENRDVENTFDFIFAKSFSSSYESFEHNKPSLINIQALTNCKLYKIHRDKLNSLLAKNPSYFKITFEIIEELFIKKVNREISLLKDSPEEVYKNLLSKEPHLFQNIPLKYIASYIGITPQALSRIRKRIF